MAGLRKVLEKISSGEKADKSTQTRRSLSCHNCYNQSPFKKDSSDDVSLSPTVTTRGHIYEDPRDNRATENGDHCITKQTPIKEVQKAGLTLNRNGSV